jgi:hypothetical protein
VEIRAWKEVDRNEPVSNFSHQPLLFYYNSNTVIKAAKVFCCENNNYRNRENDLRKTKNYNKRKIFGG